MKTAILSFFLFCASFSAWAAKPLNVYFIDVEGGQATLFVSPSGESMLVDAGWDGFNGRDAERILQAAKDAGVKEINYLVVTHYHSDHVGGVPQLAAKIKIDHFVDHGPSFEHGERPDALFAAYEQVRQSGDHIVAKPGDKLPLKGIDVEFVTAAGEVISGPLLQPGTSKPRQKAGVLNPTCATAQVRDIDPSENSHSVGMLLTFCKFRMSDLGDLTWNKEIELVCPNNRVGTVDVYLANHHGTYSENGGASGSPQIVQALAPRVAIIDNGAKKGGAPEDLQIIRQAPGLEDIWQLHSSAAAGKDNAPETYIANLANPDEDAQGDRGYWIKLSAESNGKFSITNGRTGEKKDYLPAGHKK